MALVPNPGDSDRARAGRVLSAVAAIIGAISSVAALVFVLYPTLEPQTTNSSGETSTSIPTWIYVTVGLGIAGTAVGELYRRRIVQRRRERSHALDQQIASTAAEGASHSEIKERVASEIRSDEKSLAIHQVDKFFVDEGPQLKEVTAVIVGHPPMLPRAAKRMLNHARLLTSIANERGTFGGEPALTPTQLGKWIVLIERWPAVARRVARDPALLARLEKGAFESLAPDVYASDELEALIRMDPALGPVLTRLVEIHRPPGVMTSP
jgi:hypothetical protein